MDGSSLLQMNLRSRGGSTSSRVAHEGQGDSGQAIERGNRGGQEVAPLAPHPFSLPPPPRLMTPVEIMVELLAAHRESAAAHQEIARAMDIMA